MDNVIRLSKFVKNLGIVTTVLFLIVSNSEYENTSIGDSKRICRRKSALGLEYSTIHD